MSAPSQKPPAGMNIAIAMQKPAKTALGAQKKMSKIGMLSDAEVDALLEAEGRE